MLKAVVFDLDGTLLDTMPDISEAVNKALEEHGLPRRPYSDFNRLLGYGSAVMLAMACPEGTPEETAKSVLARYLQLYPQSCCVRTTLYPGVVQGLEKLRNAGLTVAVLTNKTQRTAEIVMEHYLGDAGMAFIWGNDGVRPLKPSTESAQQITAALGLPAEEIAYVGDSDTDMFYAVKAGFAAYGACWGYRGRAELEASGAEVLAEDFAELTEKLLENA